MAGVPRPDPIPFSELKAASADGYALRIMMDCEAEFIRAETEKRDILDEQHRQNR